MRISTVTLLEVDRQVGLTPFYRWVNGSQGSLVPFPSEHSPITVLHIGVKLQPGVKFHTDPNQGQVPGRPLNQAARDTAINAPLRVSRSGSLNTMEALKAALCSAEQGQALPAAGSGTPAGLRLGDVLRALPRVLLSPYQGPPTHTHTHNFSCIPNLPLFLSPGLTFFDPSTRLCPLCVQLLALHGLFLLYKHGHVLEAGKPSLDPAAPPLCHLHP